jgi:hypothetical protein
MRTLLAIALAFMTVFAVGSCGDSDDDTPDFAAGDLKGVNFAAGEVPGMEYQPDSSGLGAFARDQQEEAAEEGDQSGLKFLQDLKALGLEADYVSQFFATSRDSEINFAESISFLFEDDERAEDAVRVVREAATRNVEPAEEIKAPTLGEQAFGIRGEFEGFLTYSYGWRVGDVIQLMTAAPGDPDATSRKTLQLAEKLEAKAQEG